MGLISVTFTVHAQNVTAFLDYRDRLIAFDNGMFREIEPLRPKAFGTGGDHVAYADAIGDLKIYRNGKVTRLDRTDVVLPELTDNLFGFKVATILKVHDGEALSTLSINTGGFVVEDSVAAWYDNMQRTFNIWYAGEIFIVEDALANEPVENWKSGDNLIAWVTTVERKFKVFHHGLIHELDDVFDGKLDYKAGADVVAYRDPRGIGLKAFYQGQYLDLEATAPVSFQVGKGIAAWQTIDGSLRVLEGGRIYDAMDFAPQEYFVQDSLVVIRDRDILKVFTGGRMYEVVRYWPEEWSVSWGTLAYRAADRTVCMWREGVSQVAIREQNVVRFQMQRGLLLAVMPLNAVHVWWRGQVYEH